MIKVAPCPQGAFYFWSLVILNSVIMKIEQVDAVTFARKNSESDQILDVRRQSEYDAEHVVVAENFPLDFINQNMAELNMYTPYFIHYKGGYRSMVTISILKARGYHLGTDIIGRFDALLEAGAKVTDYVEPALRFFYDKCHFLYVD